MSQSKPTVGSVVRVTTRWPNENLYSKAEWKDNVYEGVVVRSNAWDQPDTFKIQVDNPYHPNPIIPLGRVHKLEILSGGTTAVNDEVKMFTVAGSKGQTYTVTKTGSQWTCTCPGFQFRKACKHLDEARSK